jgi:hypothetical protein
MSSTHQFETGKNACPTITDGLARKFGDTPPCPLARRATPSLHPRIGFLHFPLLIFQTEGENGIASRHQ